MAVIPLIKGRLNFIWPQDKCSTGSINLLTHSCEYEKAIKRQMGVFLQKYNKLYSSLAHRNNNY